MITFQEKVERFVRELGDVLFSLACVANLTGVDLETALKHALEKYYSRLEKSSNAGSGR